MEGPCHESSSGCTPPATAPTADSSIVMPFPDSFATARLRAERLTPEHFAELRRMDRDPEFKAMLSGPRDRSEEHTSELQSPCNLVCRLLLEKKTIKSEAVKCVLLNGSAAACPGDRAT